MSCIGSNGNLYPCGHILDANTESYGNIFSASLIDIWNSPEKQRVSSQLPLETCYTCSPFSLRINEFLTFLSELPLDEAKKLIQGGKNEKIN